MRRTGAQPAGAAARPTHGRLRPGELAEVAVLGDLGLVLEVIGWFIPLGSIFQALAILPFAVLSSRHRLRAGVIAVLAASSVGFIVGGIGIVLQTFLAGTVGISIGTTYRRGWTPLASLLATIVVAGFPIAAVTDLIDWISPGFRKLSFAQVHIIVRDAARTLDGLGEARMAHSLSTAYDWAFAHWWISIPAAELLAITVVALICLRLRVFLGMVTATALSPYTGGVAEREEDAEMPVVPVPARIEDVRYRYAGSYVDALVGASLVVEPGRLIAVVGPNGSGKSTLVRVLTGRLEPSAGRVVRAGRPGYGELHGTATVFQRPESQVLGVRVRDDLWWGMPVQDRGDPGPLLAMVGLEGMEDRESSTLSGGQLQRLAIAAALARRPSLLVSDESTAMVDREGRDEVVALLDRLRLEGLAVVHVTHRLSETAVADVVEQMRDGRIVASGPPRADSTIRGAPELRATVAGEQVNAEQPPLVRLRGIGYVYADGTPWAHRALAEVDLDLRRGEGLVVTGANGSGKTTLAWLLGGLMAPTEGLALIGTEPMRAQAIDSAPARVGVAFQHARLQLLKPTVLKDVMIGGDEEAAREALAAVALDPDDIGPRRVDDLSGGEQRRVALAGLLVRRPELLVLDEPYAGLDDEARLALAQVLHHLRLEYGIATVVVSHDLDNAEMLGARLVHLDAGRIVLEEVLAS